MKKLILAITFLVGISFAQNSRVVNNQPTRLPNGKPGLGYWQQQIDYKIKTELNPKTKIVTGEEIITYKNNSPDTLKEIWWHLYQNIFNEKSEARKSGNIVGRAMAATKGIEIKGISVGGVNIDFEINETLMKTNLINPLPPNSQLEIKVEWNYDVPSIASLRTGSNGTDFGICQWYPQIAVYDDMRGWDKTPYLGQGEFYLDYGNWEVEITVPANHIIAATGILQNAEEVLTIEQLKRYNLISSDSVLKIIPATETDTVRNKFKDEKKVWKFKAENVRDFAWASSPRYIWDATKTKDGIFIHAFYLPSESENWKDGANLNKFTIEFFSKEFGQYIYPQATVVSGPVYGMEYPMMVFVSGGEQFTNLMELTLIHELGHEWYPMMIGNHETNYPFMDEGFNTYITSTAVNEKFGNSSLIKREFYEKAKNILQLPETNDKLFNQSQYISKAISGDEISLSSSSYDARADQYGVFAYSKPGSILWMLRDLMGDEKFNLALNEYYKRWLLKHPYPEDFFNTIEDVYGKDLDWFWNEWIYQTWKLDLAINKIKQTKNGNNFDAIVSIKSNEMAFMPATIKLTLANGDVVYKRYSEDIFVNKNAADFIIKNLPAKIIFAELDPEQNLSDINKLNNTWPHPKFNFTFGLGGVWNSVAPKMDSYNFNFTPNIAFNKIDKFEVGVGIAGNYLNTNGFEFDSYFGNGKPDFIFSSERNHKFFGPNIKSNFSINKMDGFLFSNYTITSFDKSYFGFLGNSSNTIIFEGGIKTAQLLDRKYERVINSWEDKKEYLGFFSIKNGLVTNKLNSSSNLIFLFNLPNSEYNFSQIIFEKKTKIKIGKKSDFSSRVYWGNSIGIVPNQNLFSLSRGTYFDQITSIIFRNQVFSESFYNNTTFAGGGNLFTKNDTAGTKIISINSAIKLFGVNLFADAGKVWSNDKLSIKDFSYDAGFYFNFFESIEPLSNLGLNGISIYFPIYVKDDFIEKGKEFAFRWKLVFGVRL